MAHHQPFQIFGFHSCDKKLGLQLVSGDDQLRHSVNPYDWLGSGIYFWEQNPENALEYAVKCAIGEQKFSGDIQTPFVIGAIIDLGKCLNLVEPQSLKIIEETHSELKETMKKAGKPMPTNAGPNRKLDCAVIQNIIASHKVKSQPYDTVRSPFHEDDPVYETSAFTRGLHIEVCVINPDMISGYFLPRPIDQYNPYLNSSFNKEGKKAEYAMLKAARKR